MSEFDLCFGYSRFKQYSGGGEFCVNTMWGNLTGPPIRRNSSRGERDPWHRGKAEKTELGRKDQGGRRSGRDPVVMSVRSDSKMGLSFFLSVPIMLRMPRKRLANSSVRKSPAIFWRSLGIRIPRSSSLLVKGTLGSDTKRKTEERYSWSLRKIVLFFFP